METNHPGRLHPGNIVPLLSLTLGLFLAGGPAAPAQTRLMRTEPGNGDTGVSPSTTVVFYFSDTMDPDATTVAFFSLSPFGTYPASEGWNPAHTVLTCTPDAPFPGGTQITWVLQGMDDLGLDVFGQGAFTTAGGSGGTGSGTNRLTGFWVGIQHVYEQNSAAAPALDPDLPYHFGASTALASNRTATAISVQAPGGAVYSLTSAFGRPEFWTMSEFATDLAAFNATYPAGDYEFSVLSSQSNQTVTVTLPASTTQPNAPHLSNYASAQAVNPSQPFTLSWDAFSGGTANDYIYVTVGNAWKTPDPLEPGALNGAATSATIPAGTLQPNTAYDVDLGFYRYSWASNGTYTTAANRATVTRLTLSTIEAVAPRPVVTNLAWDANGISFEIETTPGQTLTVISAADPTLPVAQWPVLLTTNAPDTRVRVADPRSKTSPAIFYRVRNGT